MIVTRVGHAADDGDGDLFDAIGTVEAVNGADQAGGIAGRQFQIVLADTLFIVGIAMEEDIRDRVLFTTLEDRLRVVLHIQFLILRTDTAGGGIQHDIDLVDQFFKSSGDRNTRGVECGFVRTVDQIKIIGHTLFFQCTNGKGRGEISNANQFHVTLSGNTIGQTLTDNAITGDTNFNLSHTISSL